MQIAGLDEAQVGIKISGRNINNLRYADDTTLMAESIEEGSPPPQQSSSGAASVSSCQAVTSVGAPGQGHLFENADSWCGGP